MWKLNISWICNFLLSTEEMGKGEVCRANKKDNCTEFEKSELDGCRKKLFFQISVFLGPWKLFFKKSELDGCRKKLFFQIFVFVGPGKLFLKKSKCLMVLEKNIFFKYTPHMVLKKYLFFNTRLIWSFEKYSQRNSRVIWSSEKYSL